MTDSSTEVQVGVTADLADFDVVSEADAGAAMEVRHPVTNETLRHSDGRPFTITVLGRDSEKFLKLARTQSDRRIQTQMRSRAAILTAVVEKDDIELLVNATISWDIVLGGSAPKSEANEYRKAYSKYRWLKEQVDEFVGNRGNFMKR